MNLPLTTIQKRIVVQSSGCDESREATYKVTFVYVVFSYHNHWLWLNISNDTFGKKLNTPGKVPDFKYDKSVGTMVLAGNEYFWYARFSTCNVLCGLFLFCILNLSIYSPIATSERIWSRFCVAWLPRKLEKFKPRAVRLKFNIISPLCNQKPYKRL